MTPMTTPIAHTCFKNGLMQVARRSDGMIVLTFSTEEGTPLLSQTLNLPAAEWLRDEIQRAILIATPPKEK